MAKEKRLSELETKWAKILFERGESLSKIAKRLHIEPSSLHARKEKEGWENTTIPSYESSDIVQNLRDLLFVYQVRILSEDYSSREEDLTRSVLNIRQMATALRDLSELSETTSLKDSINTAKSMMLWISERFKDDPALPKALDMCQAFYDEKASEFLRG